MTYPVVKVVVTGDNRASVHKAREVIDRALTAAGFPSHRPRHLQVVPVSINDAADDSQRVRRAVGGAA